MKVRKEEKLTAHITELCISMFNLISLKKRIDS